MTDVAITFYDFFHNAVYKKWQIITKLNPLTLFKSYWAEDTWEVKKKKKEFYLTVWMLFEFDCMVVWAVYKISKKETLLEEYRKDM